MIRTECVPYQSNIPAYVLQALDRDETLALELHLEGCASCREELAAYRAVGDRLLLALPPQSPPPALRHRLKQRLHEKNQPLRYRWGEWVRPLAWSFALLLVGLNLLSLWQLSALQRQQVQLLERVQTSQIALSMLAYSTPSIPIETSLEQMGGRLLLDKKRNVAVLVLWNLPPLDQDHTYQAWLIDEQGDRTSAGLFTPDPALPFTTVILFAPAPFSEFDALGVTVEPRGGSPRPTGPRLLKVEF